MLEIAACLTVPVATQAAPEMPGAKSAVALEPDTVFFRGRVFDRDAFHPIASVPVRRKDGKTEVLTDENGVFAFPIATSQFGRCVFSKNRSSVSCSMDNPETTRLVIGEGHTSSMIITPTRDRDWNSELCVLLWRSAKLTGVWLDSRGLPLSKRKLELKSSNVLPFEYEAQFSDLIATTDEKGTFCFDRIPSRVRWSIQSVQSEDELLAIDLPSFVIAPGEVRHVTLRSPRARRVTGVVRDSSRHPLAEAGVWLNAPFGFLSTDTGSDGSFEFDRVGLGSYEIKAVFPQEYDAVREGVWTTLVVGEASGDVVADLVTSPMQSIDGRLVDAQHHAVGRGEIWFEPEAMPYSGRVDVERTGAFSLSGLFPGECRLLGTNDERTIRSATYTASPDLSRHVSNTPSPRS
jgi:hypothetical protein